MSIPLTDREAAETIEQFGDDMCKLMRAFDKACNRMTYDDVERVNAVPRQDHLETIAEAFRALGDTLSRECDAREEAADRARMVSVGGKRDGGSAS